MCVESEINRNTEKLLLDTVNLGRLSHAVLLESSGAEERYALAKRLAAALVCGGDKRPCGVCPHCVKSDAESHPDILVFSGGETARSFSVDLVREIRTKAFVMPNEAERKVFILRNAGSMSAQAQNALLKILEEPPGFVTFILECASKSMMLGTVLSRAAVYTLGGEKNSSVSAEKLLTAREAAAAMCAALAKNDAVSLLKSTAVFEKDKELFRLSLPELVPLLRSALTFKYGVAASDTPGEVKALGERVPASRLLSMIDTVNGCAESVKRNANLNLMIAKLCADLI
ncbi:MAG: ATP-binding protein [Oscillospiraceae bacterium]|nr:ATP-binding protein [Oscillospiraceae bacterium]